MFSKEHARSKVVKGQIQDLEKERDHLNDKLNVVRNELSDLKAKRKREDEEVRHLVKITQEKKELEFQKKEVAADRKTQQAIADVKDQYRDKMEKELQKQVASMQTMYSDILARLPNVNVKLKGDV